MKNHSIIGRQLGAHGDMVLTAEMKAVLENSYLLSVEEQRMLFLTVVEARQKNIPIDCENMVWIEPETYARLFNVDIKTAKANMLQGGMNLFEASFEYEEISTDTGNTVSVKSRWISSISTMKNHGLVGIRLAAGIIASMKAIEAGYILYYLRRVGGLTGAYALRLYELVIQWKDIGRTMEFSVDDLREHLGVKGEYQAMCDFKKRVLDAAVSKINEHTDINLHYEQRKKGRVIEGFVFKITLKKPKAAPELKRAIRDVDTCDMFTENALTDKQLASIAASAQFKSDYITLINSTHPANFSEEQWVSEMVSRMKENPSQFDKKPLEHYLD